MELSEKCGGNKPIASVDDARYMLRWLDRITAIAESDPTRFADLETQQQVLDDFSKARDHYLEIITTAQSWDP